MYRKAVACVIVILFGILPPSTVRAADQNGSAPKFDCGYIPDDVWMDNLRAAIESGEITDPSLRVIPPIKPRTRAVAAGELPCLTTNQIFPFEDNEQLLLTDYTTTEFLEFVAVAANAMMAEYGDNFDFMGVWLNFQPHHTIGTAVYVHIEADESGTGQEPFNNRRTIGMGGENIEGCIVMWNINSTTWQPGAGGNAAFTRLALGQEFEHRFAMFLPDLLDGRALQGNNGPCGRSAHWSWRVDGQGSCMEISEWVGGNPAILEGNFVTFNTDIGGIFSYTDLYLMGYISPEEMDAGNSELRFMDNSDCAPSYFGPISHLSSTDIIASAGPRVPDSTEEDHHYRTGWIMVHLPGSPPSAAQLNKAVAIHEQHQIDWQFGTLGRGTMDDTLFADCNCNGVPDEGDLDSNGDGTPDDCEPPSIPTVSQWGLTVMVMLLLIGATTIFARRRASGAV